MHRRFAAFASLVVGVSLVALACTGDDPVLSSPTGDGGNGPNGSGDAGPTALPVNLPAALRFHNQDVRDGFAEGQVKIVKAADESDVAEYVLYWGMSDVAKAPGEPLAVFPRGAAEHVLRIRAETKPVLGATHVLVFTRNAVGESATPLAAPIENKPTFIDPTASLKVDAGTSFSARNPRVIVDTVRQKLLIVSTIDDYMGTFACDLDGTNCIFTFACEDYLCGGNPMAVIDEANQKLIIAARETANDRLVAYVCAVDGTACVKSLAPGAGQPAKSGNDAWPFIHPERGLVIFTSTNDGHLLATTCNADATTCEPSVDLNADLVADVGLAPSAVQLPDGRLAVATSSTEELSSPYLALHLTDGTAEGTRRLLGWHFPGTGFAPSIAVDTKSERLVVVTTNENEESRLLLTRCMYDGTSCSHVTAAGATAKSGIDPSAAIDLENEKILVVSTNSLNSKRPLLTRCELDGSDCRTLDFSAGQGDKSGISPSVAIDPINGYVIAVTVSANKPAIFRWGI